MLTDQAASSEDQEQGNAADHRRKDQWDRHERPDDAPAGQLAASQQPGEWDA
jgi:hypothetical protein